MTIREDCITTIEDTVSEFAQIDPNEFVSMTRTNYEATCNQYAQDGYTECLYIIYADLFDQFDIDYASELRLSDEKS